MLRWKISFVLSMITWAVTATSDVTLSRMASDSTKVLSRKRRFFIPQTSGWMLRCVFVINNFVFKKYSKVPFIKLSLKEVS